MRVTEGKEPAHFVALWAGDMIVHKGGGKSGFTTLAQADGAGASGEAEEAVRLYRVRGDDRVPPHAVQLPATAASLNSGAPGWRLAPAKPAPSTSSGGDVWQTLTAQGRAA